MEFILPTDVIIADKFAEDAESKVVSVDQIPDGWMVRLPSSNSAAAILPQRMTIMLTVLAATHNTSNEDLNRGLSCSIPCVR